MALYVRSSHLEECLLLDLGLCSLWGASGPTGMTPSWSRGLPLACALWDQQATAGGVGCGSLLQRTRAAGASSRS